MIFSISSKQEKIDLHFFFKFSQKAQNNESFLKVTPLILAIEGQNNESYWGVGPSKKEEKFPTEGGSGKVGMVSQVLPVFNYESFPYTPRMLNAKGGHFRSSYYNRQFSTKIDTLSTF